MRLVDAHHHLWDLEANYYPWLANQPEAHFFMGDYRPLKRNYLPDDYRRDARRRFFVDNAAAFYRLDRKQPPGCYCAGGFFQSNAEWANDRFRLGAGGQVGPPSDGDRRYLTLGSVRVERLGLGRKQPPIEG